MPASGRKPSTAPRTLGAASHGDAVAQVDAACRRVVAGKLATKELAGWVRELGVTESEFRLLWQLEFSASGDAVEAGSRHESPPDQAMLAERLALSPAQLSGLVERLGATGLIEPERCSRDRRRQTWRISLAGRLLVGNVVARVGLSHSTAATAQEAA